MLNSFGENDSALLNFGCFFWWFRLWFDRFRKIGCLGFVMVFLKKAKSYCRFPCIPTTWSSAHVDHLVDEASYGIIKTLRVIALFMEEILEQLIGSSLSIFIHLIPLFTGFICRYIVHDFLKSMVPHYGGIIKHHDKRFLWTPSSPTDCHPGFLSLIWWPDAQWSPVWWANNIYIYSRINRYTIIH